MVRKYHKNFHNTYRKGWIFVMSNNTVNVLLKRDIAPMWRFKQSCACAEGLFVFPNEMTLTKQ